MRRWAPATVLALVAVLALAGTTNAWESFSYDWNSVVRKYSDKNANTDGQMHFLRALFVKALPLNKYKDGNKPISLTARQLGTIMVGDTHASSSLIAVGGTENVGDIDLHPAQQAVSHAQMAAWFTLKAFPRKWLITHAARLAAMAASGTLVTVKNTVLKDCDATIVSALAAAWTGTSDTGEKAAELMLADIDSRGTDFNGNCALAIDFATLKALAIAIQAHPHEWSALDAHYERFTAELKRLHPGVAVDIWVLRGWLYATDSTSGAGYRLLGAFGTVKPDSIDPADPRVVHLNKMRYEAYDGKGRGEMGTTDDYGLGLDTVGHVRPRALGGYPEPLNLVPQSAVGQKIVNIAETLVMKLYDTCGVDAVTTTTVPNDSKPSLTHTAVTKPAVRFEYGVVFHYKSGNVAGRRPTQVSLWIDSDGDCDLVRAGRTFPFKKGAPMTNAVWDKQDTL